MIEEFLDFIFGKNIVLVLSIQLLLFLLLIILNFSEISKRLKKIKKTVWFLLVLLIIFGSLPLIKIGIGNTETWEELAIAREFVEGGTDNYFYKNARYGPLYPYFIYIIFSIFGIEPTLAAYVDIVFFSLNILGIFLLSYVFLRTRNLV
jgi:hypothetical protein